MRTKRTIWIAVAVLALIGLWLPVVAQDAPDAFDDEGAFTAAWVGYRFTKTTRPISVFKHDEHTEFESAPDCYVCHHLYEDGQLVEEESSEDQACADCHKEDSQDGGTRLTAAYHNLCKKCHETQKKGPIACGECHVKWRE